MLLFSLNRWIGGILVICSIVVVFLNPVRWMPLMPIFVLITGGKQAAVEFTTVLFLNPDMTMPNYAILFLTRRSGESSAALNEFVAELKSHTLHTPATMGCS